MRSTLLRLSPALLLLASAACAPRASAGDSESEQARAARLSTPAWSGAEAYSKPEAGTLRERLTPMQFEVTQRDGTEPPFRNAYWNHKEHGLYVDLVSGEPLFASVHKFRSGTGWP